MPSPLEAAKLFMSITLLADRKTSLAVVVVVVFVASNALRGLVLLVARPDTK